MIVKPTFFAAAADFRQWLENHHATASELIVGFYKRASEKPSITWAESVDEALCFGWIDGIRYSLDKNSYTIRFTPRKPDSTWSTINIRRAEELAKAGRMQPAGLKVFERRNKKKARYSYEQRRKIRLPDEYQEQFRASQRAWTFFRTQPPWYQRTTTFWVLSAKKEETKQRRMATLIRQSEAAQLVGPFRRGERGKSYG